MLYDNNELYQYLIEKFNVTYIEIPEEVKYNLHNTEEMNIRYLGTYFLKSYKEIYTFFSDNLYYLKKSGFLEKKTTINILDFGSGTGGQLFGLLHAIENQYEPNFEINIHSIDGNENALEIQQKILNEYWQKYYKNKIVFNQHIHQFSNGKSIEEYLNNNFNDKFDIIITSKALSELIKDDRLIYKHFLYAADNFLNENGICLISDVTCTIDNNYIPSIINSNIKDYYNVKNKGLISLCIIIPICCFFNKFECKKISCYNQCIIDMFIHENNNITSKECKIDFKLFIKNGTVMKTLYKNLLQHKPKDDASCFINDKECYCKCNDTYFKRVFGDNKYNVSQYSFKFYEENL